MAIHHPPSPWPHPRAEVFRGLTHVTGAPTRVLKESALGLNRDAGWHEGGPPHSRGSGLAEDEDEREFPSPPGTKRPLAGNLTVGTQADFGPR